jgi:monothiol glutaredoxin
MAADTELKQKVEELIGSNPVLLFMKGTPDAPKCGFSMRVVGVLNQLGVEYGAVDVLPALQPLREVTAEISDWQTFPQLYVDGELVGGCDIVEEMYASGELAQLLGVDVEGASKRLRRGAVVDAVKLDQQPIPVAARGLHFEGGSVRTMQKRPCGEPLRVVGDGNDVDLSEDPVRLADLAGEQPGPRSGQSTTSTATDSPSRCPAALARARSERMMRP